MPRSTFKRDPRGGAREMAQGESSANRTDLNQHQPVIAAPNQPYGVKAQQQAAQRAVPLPQETQNTSVETPSASAPSATMPQQVGPAPGSLLFDHPSTRPAEPITHGMPFGPGGGPEVLGQAPSIADQLGALASLPNASSTLQNLAATARLAGY